MKGINCQLEAAKIYWMLCVIITCGIFCMLDENINNSFKVSNNLNLTRLNSQWASSSSLNNLKSCMANLRIICFSTMTHCSSWRSWQLTHPKGFSIVSSSAKKLPSLGKRHTHRRNSLPMRCIYFLHWVCSQWKSSRIGRTLPCKLGWPARNLCMAHKANVSFLSSYGYVWAQRVCANPEYVCNFGQWVQGYRQWCNNCDGHADCSHCNNGQNNGRHIQWDPGTQQGCNHNQPAVCQSDYAVATNGRNVVTCADAHSTHVGSCSARHLVQASSLCWGQLQSGGVPMVITFMDMKNSH